MSVYYKKKRRLPLIKLVACSEFDIFLRVGCKITTSDRVVLKSSSIVISLRFIKIKTKIYGGQVKFDSYHVISCTYLLFLAPSLRRFVRIRSVLNDNDNN